MGNLILVRHGESLGNRERVFAVRPSEQPLTELGYQQGRKVAQQIAARFRAEVVVASPYLRARETARVIAETLNLPVDIEPMLYEREVGVFQGQSYESIYGASDFDHRRPWLWKPEGGESYEEVRLRVGPVLDRLAKAHPSRDVVIVSHGGVMQTLWAHVTGDWSTTHTPPNCGMVLIEHSANGYLSPKVIGNVAAADARG
jgi:broad specificity phosphatase PhoE